MVYLLILGAIFLLMEWYVVSRDRKHGKGKTDRDRGTRTFNIVSITLSVIIALLLSLYTSLPFPGGKSGIYFWTGIFMIAAGIVIRAWAIATLGASFRITIETHEGQSVVQSGAYRFIRHPSYSGAAVTFAGYGIAFQNWLSLLILIAVPFIAFANRIKHEEAELVRTLGTEYTDYRKKTKKLIPFVW